MRIEPDSMPRPSGQGNSACNHAAKKIINFAFSKSALTIVSRKRDFIKVGKSLYLPTFSFSSLSYPYYSITALILFILLILRLNNFNPLPT